MMVDSTHLLLALDRYLNLSFILQEVSRYYRQTTVGRTSVVPLILVKTIFIQTFEGCRSVRFTCRQIHSNVTYRWFLGISPFRPVPHHSTISRFLWGRLQGASFWQTLFTTQLR